MSGVVEALEERVKALTTRLQLAIDARHPEYVETFNQAGALSAEVEECLKRLETIGLNLERGTLVVSQSDDLADLSARHAFVRDLATVLRLACRCQGLLDDFDEMLSLSNLSGCAVCVTQAAALLHDLRNAGVREASLINVLGLELSRRRSRLLAQLRMLWDRVFAVHAPDEQLRGGRITVRKRSDTIRASEVEAALLELDALASVCAPALDVLRTALVPLLTRSAAPPAPSVRLEATVTDDTAVLELVPSLASAPSGAAASDEAGLVQRCHALCSFFDEVLPPTSAVRGALATGVFAPLRARIVSECLQPQLPHDVAELEAFVGVWHGAIAWEHECIEVGLLARDAPLAISEFLAHVFDEFLANHRAEVLQRVQQHVRRSEFNSILVGGTHDDDDDNPIVARSRGALAPDAAAKKGASALESDSGLFYLPPMRVTSGAQSLLGEVRAALRSMVAALSSAHHGDAAYQRFADAEYQLARDALDLYRAAITVMRRGETPSQMVLLRNDCVYLAHRLLTLAHVFRPQLPREMRDRLTFIDMVPYFLDLAEEVLGDLVVAEQSRAMQFVNDVSDLSNAAQVDKAVASVLAQCRALEESLEALLPPDTLRVVAGLVALSAAKALFELLMGETSLSADAPKYLHRIFRPLAQLALRVADAGDAAAAAAAAVATSSASAPAAAPAAASQAAAARHIGAVTASQLLGRLSAGSLESRLPRLFADITELMSLAVGDALKRVQSGALAAIRHDEMLKLAKLLFVDSDARRALVESVRG